MSKGDEVPARLDPHALPLRVLLLEDSRFDAELLVEALKASYPQVTLQWTHDEDGFVSALAQGGFDLIISDYELPGFSGGAALDHARMTAPNVPFIFVSGVIGEDNAVELLKRGATDYVSKGRLARLPVVIERAIREAAQKKAYEDAQRRLRKADITFESVVDALRDYAVILLSPEGDIRSWTRAAEEVFGYAANDVVGRSVGMLFTMEDRERGVPAGELQQARLQGKASDDRWMLRADGTRLWAEGSVTRLEGAPDAYIGFCKIVRDATASYAHSRALSQAKEEAERANRAKDRFLAVLSHELRTPLSPISSAAHILQRVADIPSKYQGLLPMIQRNVALEARLIEDLLDLTAISEGKLMLKRGNVDLHRLILAVVEMVSDQISEKRLELALELTPDEPLVDADEARMQQVLWNIIRNAIKFTPQDGRVTIRTSVEAGQFRFECTDSGIGIDPSALPRIFMAFEQADAEVSRSYGGLGLGLAIAKGLVAQHGGEMLARSEGRGKGATFVLTLPLLDRDKEAGLDGAEPGSVAGVSEGGCRLLIVEDNEDAADALRLSLEILGYTVSHAVTRAQGLRMAREGRFDVVITDLGLPDGSGIDIGLALRGVSPVIALSGYGSPQDVRRSTDAGFAAHLVKPADPATVHATIQQLLAARRSAMA